jgi:hypothetical protein
MWKQWDIFWHKDQLIIFKAHMMRVFKIFQNLVLQCLTAAYMLNTRRALCSYNSQNIRRPVHWPDGTQ